MAASSNHAQGQARLAGLLALIASPAVLMFVSSNLVNVGNFSFNLIFSRLMAPAAFADLAFLLTVKLVSLSVLSALQMAVSKQVADNKVEAADLRQFLSLRSPWLWGGMALVIGALWLTGAPLGRALAILALACPLILPLSILRGLALGQINMRATIWSAQMEMIARLGLSLLFWFLGWGLLGIGLALALSLLLAWAPLQVLAPKAGSVGKPILKGLAIAALPFGVLQVAQVLITDGDVLVARAILSGEEAGFLAALSLLQRIQFFACFGLAAVLMPSIIRKVQADESLGGILMQMIALYLITNLPLIAFSVLAPATFLGLVVGSAYLEAAPLVWMACVAGALFTLTYLTLTLLIALGSYRLLWIALGFAVVQLSLQAITPWIGGGDAGALLIVKLSLQSVLACLALVQASLALRSV